MNAETFISKFNFGQDDALKINLSWPLIEQISNYLNQLIPKAGWFPNPKKRSDLFLNYCGLVETKFIDQFSSKSAFFNTAIYAMLLTETKNNNLKIDKMAFLELYRRGRYSFGEMNFLAYQIGELAKRS